MSSAQELAPDVLDALRLGDEVAQAHLYQHYTARVHALAFRLMGQSADAQDVAQEAFIRCFDAIHQYRGEAPFWAWLKQIVIRIALSRIRSERRWHWVSFEHWFSHAETDSAAPQETAADGDNLAERMTRDLDLAAAMSQLSQTARAVLYLYHAEGCSHGEIAALWGKSVSFSKSQLARAHQRLRELLTAQELVTHMGPQRESHATRAEHNSMNAQNVTKGQSVAAHAGASGPSQGQSMRVSLSANPELQGGSRLAGKHLQANNLVAVKELWS